MRRLNAMIQVRCLAECRNEQEEAYYSDSRFSQLFFQARVVSIDIADYSKLGTILILAVIWVGVLLTVSSGISAWQSYQNIVGRDDRTGTPVPTP